VKVDIDKTGAYTVSIQGGFTGPYINLDLSPEHAYALLQALDAKRDELHDLATNYYSCSECGETHPKSVQQCPNLK
jgi:hypothetical protein